MIAQKLQEAIVKSKYASRATFTEFLFMSRSQQLRYYLWQLRYAVIRLASSHYSLPCHHVLHQPFRYGDFTWFMTALIGAKDGTTKEGCGKDAINFFSLRRKWRSAIWGIWMLEWCTGYAMYLVSMTLLYLEVLQLKLHKVGMINRALAAEYSILHEILSLSRKTSVLL